MCIEVFEHIPAPILAIKEFNRILRGGILILTAPVCSLTHFAPYYFYNGFSRYFYEIFLDENGFITEELSFNGNWFEYVAEELHRVAFVVAKYCGFGGKMFKVLFEIMIVSLMIFFSYASKVDKGSSEILCHGIHVKAKSIE